MGSTIRTAVLALVGFAAAVFCGCAPEKAEAPVAQARIAVDGMALSAPLYVAREKGFFRDSGIDVTLIPCRTGLEALDHLGKGADLATSADFPIAAASFHRSDFRILATISSTRDEPVAIARKSVVRSPRDLAGKRIGITPGTVSGLFLETLLTLERVPAGSVTRVAMNPGEMAVALKDGSVDAVITWNPYLAEVEAVPDTVGFSTDAFLVVTNLLCEEKYLRANPESCRRLMHALKRTEGFIRTHRDEAMEIVRRALPAGTRGAARYWRGYDFDLRLREPLLVQLDNDAAWLVSRGGTRTVPDFNRLLAPEPLQAVDPGAVRLIR